MAILLDITEKTIKKNLSDIIIPNIPWCDVYDKLQDINLDLMELACDQLEMIDKKNSEPENRSDIIKKCDEYVVKVNKLADDFTRIDETKITEIDLKILYKEIGQSILDSVSFVEEMKKKTFDITPVQ